MLGVALHLHSSNLFSGTGFDDGRMPAPLLLWLRGEHVRFTIDQWHRALAEMVRQQLLPLLPGLVVAEYVGQFNPIRAVAYRGVRIELDEPISIEHVEVYVPFDVVRQYIVAAVHRSGDHFPEGHQDDNENG